MKLHRFYIGERHPRQVQHFGAQRCWVQDQTLRHQWQHVLRFNIGEQLVLFNDEIDCLYSISEIKDDEIVLEKVTEITRRIAPDFLLAWGLLKKDNNEFVLQKGTELGVTRFVPLLTNRVEKSVFDYERAEKILVEASEQCGRSDIPFVSEPCSLDVCLNTYGDHYSMVAAHIGNHQPLTSQTSSIGVCIGPEGGWSDDEVAFFIEQGISLISLHQFTLRAETAAIAAAAFFSALQGPRK